MPLRSVTFRGGAPLYDCYFRQDGKMEACHFGLKENDSTVAIVSLYRRRVDAERVPDNANILLTLPACQLRGMAVAKERQKKGLGGLLLSHSLSEISHKWSPDYFWCYAVADAVGFYERFGFARVGHEFEMPYTGPLTTMVLYLRDVAGSSDSAL